jgi:tRNA(Ile)-lysidine synthetase-like protein
MPVQTPVKQVRRLNAYRTLRGAWHEPVLLACSGGVDSTALLALAAIARDSAEVAPFVVVHVDHRTRPDSAEDARHITGLCREWRIPLVRCTVEQSLESADEASMRAARYNALSIVADRLTVSGIVTAHTLDDQVETILMRLFTGASGTSLAGMRKDQILDTAAGQVRILRPLLRIRRSELQVALDMLEIEAVEDPSNRDRRYRRNAVRHDVIPAIESVFPDFRAPLLRFVELAKRDADALDTAAQQAYDVIATARSTRISLRRSGFRDLSPAIASRVVRIAAASLNPGGDQRELTFERTESVRTAASGRTGATIELPYCVVVHITPEHMVFERTGSDRV